MMTTEEQWTSFCGDVTAANLDRAASDLVDYAIRHPWGERLEHAPGVHAFKVIAALLQYADTLNDQVDNLQGQITALEARVSTLEGGA